MPKSNPTKGLSKVSRQKLWHLCEIKRRQVGVVIDVAEDSLKQYDSFSARAFAEATRMLEEEKVKRDVDNISVEALDQVISDHKKLNLPFFKYVIYCCRVRLKMSLSCSLASPTPQKKNTIMPTGKE